MKNTFIILIGLILMVGCQSQVRTNRVNPYEVTVNHGPLKSQEYIYGRAQEYCNQFGRTASFKGKFDSSNSVFECR
jgi:hypothetical protein